ncbi:DUF5677 domain-containing protein [Romboutsia sedimentorum]|uniref:DUF5677 domain-containing protein n=1 Tax=Romboutsia sedimentorum TaxID=1368474 RepID=A0ABT7EEM7_9FIRM|nr:DUF5677 domain-containing protein [Romboutsia sedimentorum]MDK2563935.1 DUF5677 domain-containing protein [Romboutsia sedimentorum]
MKEQYTRDMDKLISKFIRISKKFIDTSAFSYGIADLIIYNKVTNKFTYDYEYFALTKSTKTLESIRQLIRIEKFEDSIILTRSIFENYLSCRYLNQNENKIKEFIFNPLGLALAYYNLDNKGNVFNRNKEKIGTIENPTKFRLGKDRNYYYKYYDFLSRFTHCNFGVMDCYYDIEKPNGMFYYDKINYDIHSRLFIIFTFTKLFEHIVTVEGEEFKDIATEKQCYALVEESLKFQEEIFTYLIDHHCDSKEIYKFSDKRMKEMLKEMRKSLKEELGNIKK